MTCADEKKFFQETFSKLEKGISAVNFDIVRNITNTVDRSID